VDPKSEPVVRKGKPVERNRVPLRIPWREIITSFSVYVIISYFLPIYHPYIFLLPCLTRICTASWPARSMSCKEHPSIRGQGTADRPFIRRFRLSFSLAHQNGFLVTRKIHIPDIAVRGMLPTGLLMLQLKIDPKDIFPRSGTGLENSRRLIFKRPYKPSDQKCQQMSSGTHLSSPSQAK